MFMQRNNSKKFFGAPPRTPTDWVESKHNNEGSSFHIVMEYVSFFVACFALYWVWVILP
jgi:hypothetical protein